MSITHLCTVEVDAGKEAPVTAASDLLVNQRDHLCREGINVRLIFTVRNYLEVIANFENLPLKNSFSPLTFSCSSGDIDSISVNCEVEDDSEEERR